MRCWNETDMLKPWGAEGGSAAGVVMSGESVC